MSAPEPLPWIPDVGCPFDPEKFSISTFIGCPPHPDADEFWLAELSVPGLPPVQANVHIYVTPYSETAWGEGAGGPKWQRGFDLVVGHLEYVRGHDLDALIGEHKRLLVRNIEGASGSSLYWPVWICRWPDWLNWGGQLVFRARMTDWLVEDEPQDYHWHPHRDADLKQVLADAGVFGLSEEQLRLRQKGMS
jgi:hypothetical protein